VRHYFFDMGNDSLLAFFEITKGKEPAGNRNAIGAMQHCAFVVGGVVRIEGTDTVARQDAFSRVPSFLARFLTN
jgi:hypothetical protein